MISIENATPADAAALSEMLTELDLLEGNPGEIYTEERVLRDAFGSSPAFFSLIAYHRGQPVGYLLWYPAYDTDLMARKMWVSDIYVREEARGLRCGFMLMQRAVQEAIRLGYQSLELPVRHENKTARSFYEKAGGKNKNSTIYRWEQESLKKMTQSP